MSDLPGNQKAALRSAALIKRDALGRERRAAAAQALAQRGLPIELARGAVIAGYAPIRTEIDPFPLMQELAAQGVALVLPVIVAQGQPLAFRRFSPDDKLERGPLGILQPSSQAMEMIPDAVLVPLAAFDRAGHRIGYGAGYYDRTLAQLREVNEVIAIGLAFAIQEIPAIAADPHDVTLDYVLTEENTFDFRSS